MRMGWRLVARRGWAPAAGLVICAYANAHAQPDCKQLIRSRPQPEYVANSPFFALADTITGAYVLERRSQRSELVVTDPQSYPAVRRRLLPLTQGDSASVKALAGALAFLMGGAGGTASSEQGRYAADLYAALPLPFEPAAALLADPKATGEQRWYAVLALKRYYLDARFPSAALAALCLMSARSTGLAAVMTSPSDGDLLSSGEQDAVGSLMLALGGRADSLHTEVRPSAVLPDSSPLARYLRFYFPHEW